MARWCALGANKTQGEEHMKKRLTVMVSEDIDRIRSKIYEETGVFMTYVQVFDFLITFYVKNQKAQSTWRQ